MDQSVFVPEETQSEREESLVHQLKVIDRTHRAQERARRTNVMGRATERRQTKRSG